MTTSEPWLDDLRAQTTGHLAQIEQLQADLAEVYGEARTCSGRVHVRVNAAGRPTALTLDPAIAQVPAPELAEAILAAVAEASAVAGSRLAAVVGSLVPPDQLDAMLTGFTGVPSDADRVAVRQELDGLRPRSGN